MKFIQKSRQEPNCVKSWKRANKSLTVNKDYASMNCHGQLRKILLEEQGSICAYTMQRIEIDICHIEHFIPQAQCQWSYQVHGLAYSDDTSYHNMLACYPGSEQSCEYGAIFKGSTQTQVSPLHQGCEKLFKFDANGRVEGATGAASSTINILNLNHRALIELRKSEISGRGVSKRSRRKKSQKQAEVLATEVLNKDKNGAYSPFCLAVHQVASSYAKKLSYRTQGRLRSPLERS
jgi:uncharacterized protein (TIGR02646 family)